MINKTSNPDFEQEKDMLQSILQLNDITVEEVSKTLKITIRIVYGTDDFVRKIIEIPPNSF